LYYYKHNRRALGLTRIYYSADRKILDLLRVDHADAEHPTKYAGAQPLPPETQPIDTASIYERRRQAENAS
jgi:hypothetical protein